MIELYKVSKTVQSGAERLTILHELDLTVPDGQFVSVVGPSGSGKSTLLGLVAGLDAPTSGRIVIDGEEITAMGEDALATLRGRKIGIVFQSFHLVPSMTAYENILAPLEIAGRRGAAERARQLLGDVDLTERAHHYPSQLSGGEQQRVAVARAFANEPKILLADEPTGNLDSRNGAHVFDLMLELNRRSGTTLVLVTHDRELAARADRRVSLRDGRVVSDETFDRAAGRHGETVGAGDETGPSEGAGRDDRTGRDLAGEELEAARS
jgi:putative ABC transport system ATP-binding protein